MFQARSSTALDHAQAGEACPIPLSGMCVCDGQGGGSGTRNLPPQVYLLYQGLSLPLLLCPRLQPSPPFVSSLPVSPLLGPMTTWQLTSPPMNWPKGSHGTQRAGGQAGRRPLLQGSLFPSLLGAPRASRQLERWGDPEKFPKSDATPCPYLLTHCLSV